MTAAREPGPLAVSLAELKVFLRISGTEEDALLAALTRSAVDVCEAFTGRLLVVRAVEEVIAKPRGWSRLGAAPVRGIDGLASLNAEGTAVELSADAYAIDIDAAGEGWVRLAHPIDQGRMRVRYQAGLADDPGGVPEAIRQGVVRLAAHFYTFRDAMNDAGAPAAVSALWRPWRRLRMK